MARITVEDCLENVNNRFDLVIKAARRARQLANGSSEAKVPWENDKATVVALREIAQGYVFHEEKSAPVSEDSLLTAGLESAVSSFQQKPAAE